MGALNGTTDPIVYVAFEVLGPNQTRQIALTAANAQDITQWVSPTLIPVPPGGTFAFRPSLSFDATNNVLDLLDFDLAPVSGTSNQLRNINLNTFFYRFDASSLQPVLSQYPSNRAAPTLSRIPSRPEPDLSPSIFPGEYIGLATKGLTAFAAFPELSRRAGDRGLVVRARSTRPAGGPCQWSIPIRSGSAPVSAGRTSSISVPIVGCASGSATTAATACPQVCTQTALCGGSLACTPSMTCSGGFTAGHQLSAQTCALADGPAAGAPPASAADFTAADVGASTALVTLAAAPPVTTAVSGQAFFNSSTSPPTAGSRRRRSRACRSNLRTSSWADR